MKIIRKADQQTRAVLSLDVSPELFLTDQGFDPDDYTVEYSEAEQREIIRRDLVATVGDTETRLEAVSDTLQLALGALATLLKALPSATTLADLQTAMVPYTPAFTAFIDAVEGGQTRLPYATKGDGIDDVLNTVAQQANRISDVLENPTRRPPQKPSRLS